MNPVIMIANVRAAGSEIVQERLKLDGTGFENINRLVGEA